jgi:hypothetical protein
MSQQPFIDIISECERIWGVKLSHINIVVFPARPTPIKSTTVGECFPSQSRIVIKPITTYTEVNIIKILTHELAHYVDWYRSGGKWRVVNGRGRYHDKVFKAILAKVAVSHPEWVQDLKKRGVLCQ